MNVICLTGRLCNEIEPRVTPNGKTIASFSLAVRKDQENTNFFRCVAFGKIADNIIAYFHKGSMIALTGSLDTNKWTDKEGHNRESTSILVNGFSFVESKGTQNVVQTELPPDPLKVDFDDTDAELPF